MASHRSSNRSSRIIWQTVVLGVLFLCVSVLYSEPRTIDWSERSLEDVISKEIRDTYPFRGLAAYYNNLSFWLVSDSETSEVEGKSSIALVENEWLVVVGRYNVLVLQGSNAKFIINPEANDIVFDRSSSADFSVYLTDKSAIAEDSPELSQLRYGHLVWPISSLAKGIEYLLATIHKLIPVNWGLSVILLAVSLKVLVLPLSLLTTRFQKGVSQTKAILGPKIAAIKREYSGEEAHNRIVSAHKEAGVSLFYALKPMSVTLIQIPILIAVFNALGEMPQLQGESFLWIGDLAYPDTIASLPFELPLLGSELSLLPLLMTLVSILSSIAFTDSHLSKQENKKQKLPLYGMAAAFLLLFYPFPAAMVLYWTINNVLHLIQQRLLSE